MTVSSFFSSIGSGIKGIFLPKTARGRVRQATAIVAIILVLAGNYSRPDYWNSAASSANAKLAAVHAPAWLRVPSFWVKPFHLGLDLQGGTHLVYIADVKNIPDSQRSEALSGVRDVIERRVNAFGVSEPLVQTNQSGNSWRVIVDLAGIKDVNQAIKQIGETPILEFKERNDQPQRPLTVAETQAMNVFNSKVLAKAKSVLAQALNPKADFAALAKQNSDDAATKNSGGDLGFITKTGDHTTIYTEIQTKGIKPGMVVNDTILEGGVYHVVKLVEQRENGKEVNASHILLCWKDIQGCASTRTKDQARALMENLKSRATPADFAALAKQYSDDKGSGAQGGSLGWFGAGAMVQPFEDTAMNLGVGQISDIIESQYGFHIIYKIGERPLVEYHVDDIAFKTETAADILPPADDWKNTQLSGKQLKNASLQFDSKTNEPQVALAFDDEGKKLFGDITTRNVGKPVGIFLDGQPLSLPTVNEPITDGSAIISGNFTIDEAKLLVRRLNAGALPVPISLESQTTVGASLGQESLAASLKAGAIGFLVVALFMLLYYRLPGLIAVFALSLYTAINLSLYKFIPVTLTLSGIAGFILSVGMAVDANVLIFERMKEELLHGRPVSSALEEGFRRAWTSIRDSNTTTLISCVILYYTSSSLIKGFAFTLALGVLVSMFSAVTVSRTLLRLVSGWKIFKSESLYLPGLVKKPAVAEKK